MLEEYDELTIRCPQLGGPAPFKYCRAMNMKLPCRRVVQCFEMKFNVGEWLEENFSPEQLEQAFQADDRSRLQKILQIAYDARKEGKK